MSWIHRVIDAHEKKPLRMEAAFLIVLNLKMQAIGIRELRQSGQTAIDQHLQQATAVD